MSVQGSKSKELVVVLGMHRSGTSALAGVFGELGFQMPKTLMQPSKENENGYWESYEIYRLHEELFAALDYTWNDYRRFPFESLSASLTNQFVESMVKALYDEFPGDEVGVLKDPRICILMPFWNDIFRRANIEPLFVIPVRNPLEVAASISARDGSPRERSMLLWLRHIIGAELETRNRLRCFISYESLLNDWHSVVMNISTSLKMDLTLVGDAALRIDRFLSPKLRHFNFSDNDIDFDKNISPWVSSLYKAAIQAAESNNVDRLSIFDEISLELNNADLLFGNLTKECIERLNNQHMEIVNMNEIIVKYTNDISTLKEALSESKPEQDRQSIVVNTLLRERDEQMAKHINALTVRDREYNILKQDIASSVQQLNNIIKQLEESDNQIISLNKEVSDRDGNIAILNQIIDSYKENISSLNKIISERDSQIYNLTDETVRRGEWALGLDAQLKNTQAQLQSLYRSNSWRLTLPLRELRYWITTPVKQTKRYTKAVLKRAKKVYQSMPFSYQERAVHRMLLSKYFPFVLRVTNSQLHNVQLPVHHNKTIITEQASNISMNLRASSIKLPIYQNPKVSVIIPIYGKCNYTMRCLASIAASLPRIHFEVIVVDDCSPDNSVDLLEKVTGLHLVRNKNNQGFIRSCNLGAKYAKGTYICFLNNDTEVTSGWLDELIRTFYEFPGTGLAGSKLIYPDGRLQEAGGIIWNDGSAWNFGRYQDPSLPVYNYAREVDYCSGASIMLPKELFDRLGGFDEHYLPAYCEDSDLALKIRDKGYRVIYQPMSTIVHYEGITSGTDTSSGAKSYQIENSKKLFARWKARLQQHQCNGLNVDRAKDRRAMYRVLILDHCTPTPNQDAGSVTVFNLMLLLRELNFQVTFIPEDNFLYMAEYTTALQRAGIEVLYAPYVRSVEDHLKECGDRYDLAFLFRPIVVERHLKSVRKHCLNAKILYHTVDLHYLRISREAELHLDETKQKLADEMKQRELSAVCAADASIVHSSVEFDLLRTELPDAKLHVFPLIVDVVGTSKKYSDRRDIVFIGGYQHTPNIDAVKYFVAEIMPLLRNQLPGVRFYAVGSSPPVEIQELASFDVVIAGFVENLNAFLDKMRVSVAPLRYGAGIKGKIGSAMAVGLPVVASSLAVEGMSLCEGESILVADGAQAIADNIVNIYKDELLWDKISQNGLVFAAREWGALAARKTLSDIVSDLGFKDTCALYPLSLYSQAVVPEIQE